MMSMSLGSTILTEATLSFLGLGVKFPFAYWGNIINDVNDTYVLTNYWFIWIPAGVCLLLTVLAGALSFLQWGDEEGDLYLLLACFALILLVLASFAGARPTSASSKASHSSSGKPPTSETS